MSILFGMPQEEIDAIAEKQKKALEALKDQEVLFAEA